MKAAFRTLMGLAIVLAAVAVVAAEEDKDKKSKKLEGELGCAKCVFKVKGITKCTNAIKVKEDGKEVVYILQDKGAKEPYHKKICTGAKTGSVTGVVAEKDGKHYITPNKDGVKFD